MTGNKNAVAFVVLAGALVLLAVQQWRLSGWHFALVLEEQAGRAQVQQLAATVEKTTADVDKLAQTVAALKAAPTVALQQAQTRLVKLETEMEALNHSLAQRGMAAMAVPSVPEYDPTQPPPPEPVVPPPTNVVKRGWSAEQVLGPPDTPTAGDFQTAWTSRDPDGGLEWLTVGFERPTEIAEVRTRESYNPGAIVKVVAQANNQEVVLWEGEASGGRVPRDFVVRPTGSVVAQSVTVHLDTTRVAGWNEIDAVELVGRDGSRQWAVTASASSSYADRFGAVPTEMLNSFRLR